MDQWNGFSNESPQLVLLRIKSQVSSSKLTLSDIQPYSRLEAVGRRDYSTGILFIFVIIPFLWPFAVGYYFSRKQNKLTAELQGLPNGTNVSLTAQGKIAEKTLKDLSAAFSGGYQQVPPQAPPQYQEYPPQQGYYQQPAQPQRYQPAAPQSPPPPPS